jgi:hypothetical protein
MHRRTLLQTGGLSLVALQFGLLTGCDRHEGSLLATPISDSKASNALREIAGSLDGIDFIGPVCADEFPDADLADQLHARLSDTEASLLGEALSTRIALDFSQADQIDISGWQLARTECMLLALAARERGLSQPVRQDQPALSFEDFVEIDRWGPQETIEGEIFNPVGEGRGAFWIRINNPVPRSVRLVLDGVELATHFQPGVVTASLEPGHTDQVIAQPGMHALVMVDTARNIAQRVGYLTVRARPEAAILDNGEPSSVFCVVERWGPDHAVQGEAFNQQPDGSAAVWVRIGCAPESAQLVLGDIPLPTTVGGSAVTARVPHFADLDLGDHALRIEDPPTGEILTIGILRIL